MINIKKIDDKLIKEIEERNNTIKEQKNKIKRLEKEKYFWMKRAEEGGCCDFTDKSLCGASSNSLLYYACGKDKEPEDGPWDMEDWGRCERTIATIPFLDWLDRLMDLPEYKNWKEYEAKVYVAVGLRRKEILKENA